MSKPRATLPGGPFSRSLAAVLSVAFEESRLTQAALGERLGVSQSQMSKYLRAERPMNADEIDAVCTALGLDIGAVMHAAKIGEVQKEVHGRQERINPRSGFGD